MTDTDDVLARSSEMRAAVETAGHKCSSIDESKGHIELWLDGIKDVPATLTLNEWAINSPEERKALIAARIRNAVVIARNLA